VVDGNSPADCVTRWVQRPQLLDTHKGIWQRVSVNVARDPWGLGRGGSAGEYTRLLLHSRIS